jgi:peptide/nickel transport system substrate-binding protein
MFSKKSICISLVVFLGVILSACASTTPTPVVSISTPETVAVPTETAVVSEPTILTVALASAPTTLDPADHRDRTSETVIRNMFDGLNTRDNTSNWFKELATDYTWVDDKTLEITLRQGVKFHNGDEMTADDVVFTFERIITENGIDYPEAHTSPRKGLIAPLESIEKTGDYTVVMHFTAPFPTAMQMLVHQQILPKNYFEQVGTEAFIANPIGTGPFKFVSAQPGYTEIVMDKFADFWGGSSDLPPVGPACVDTVVFRVIPEASSRVAALLAGEVDIIQNVPAALVSTLEQVPGIQVKTAPGTSPMWMELNVNKAPFDDVRVRQAMNYAIDKDLLISAIYGGKAVSLAGPLSPYNNYADKSLTPYAYDTAKALELLAAAGWTDSNGDSILDKSGQNFSFTIDTEEDYRDISEAVANQLRAIGIDASVRVWEWGVIKPLLLAGERQAFLDNWGDSAFDPVGHMEAKWHSYVANTTYGRGNFSGYANARVDQLIEEGETTVDTDARHTIYDEAQQLIYDESPAVFLILPEVVEAASARVQNWSPAADGRINLVDVCVAQ